MPTPKTSKMAAKGEFESLEIKSVIGFGGHIAGGRIKHPDGIHFIYALGSTVVIHNPATKNNQDFLQGHSDSVSCLSVSPCGNFIASGQKTHMGFKADIIIWNFPERKKIAKLSLHKVMVRAVAFSPSGKFLASLGGPDDNSIIVWDLQTHQPICGSLASSDSSGETVCLAYFCKDDFKFTTGGFGTLRTWSLDVAQRKIRPTSVQSGQIKRIVKCIVVDKNDEYMYCGTTTGDLMQVSLQTNLFKNSGPKDKNLFSMGIISLAIAPSGDAVVVGCGDGTVAKLGLPKMSIEKSVVLSGGVTSIAFIDNQTFTASTSLSKVFDVSLPDFKAEQKSSCHYSKINDICFPVGSSDIFATASDNDVRIWNAQLCIELVCIKVKDIQCLAIQFKKDGSSLLTGWNDGKIRAFGPQSGKIQYEINDAHNNGVTALGVTDPINEEGDFRIVSGGEDGQVRVWKITRHLQNLAVAMKEHKAVVTCIKIRKNNLECVSSSQDGSCIIWDLERCVRNQVLFAPSFFKCVSYFPDESQLLTTGTDRKIGYWESFDGSLIRELEASQSDAINGLDISSDGSFFVIGGNDKLIKVYRYEEGDVSFVGKGHSADITKVKLSPNNKVIVSVSADGAIFQWNLL